MKKYYLTVIALLLPLLASAYDAKIGGIYYNFNKSKRTAAVTSDQAQSYSGDVVIPSSVDYKGVTYTVTEIAPEAFFYCSVTSVSLPEGLTSIGSAAFYYCEKLTSIIIPKNVETIGDEAFKQCTGLTSLVIPNKVTSIGRKAFSLCQNIRSVTLGSSVKTIGDEAFYGLWKLTSIAYLGSTPPTLGGSYVFGGIKKDDCTVWVPNGCMSAYSAAGVLSGFSDFQLIPDNCVHIDDFTYFVPFYSSIKELGVQSGPPLSNVVIPSEVVYDGEIYSVTSIGYEAFKNTGLKSITIPESVTSIDLYAFSGCTGLTSITIPEGVTYIGICAFEGCTGLTSITIPESVTSISDLAFEGCTGLTSITIPESVTRIGLSAFGGCTALASISIPNDKINMGVAVFNGTVWYDNQPDGLVYIGDLLYEYKGEMPANTGLVIKDGTTSIAGGAFLGQGGLVRISIPGSVANIGPQAFCECNNLYDVHIDEGVEYIDYSAFQNCTSLCKITIPGSVVGIGSGAFAGCTGLWSVNISEGVQYIGNEAFQDCTSLWSVSIPNSVTEIYSSAFRNNTNIPNLSYVVIGNSVSYIVDEAFSGCYLQCVVSLNSTPPMCTDANVFANVDWNFCRLFVPKGSVEAYMDDPVWGLFPFILEYVEGDLTFDGVVDKNDLNELVFYIMYDGDNVIGIPPRTLYDINGDGKVDAADVVKLISLMK